MREKDYNVDQRISLILRLIALLIGMAKQDKGYNFGS